MARSNSFLHGSRPVAPVLQPGRPRPSLSQPPASGSLANLLPAQSDLAVLLQVSQELVGRVESLIIDHLEIRHREYRDIAVDDVETVVGGHFNQLADFFC